MNTAQALTEVRNHTHQMRDIDDRLNAARMDRCIDQLERAMTDAAADSARGRDHSAYLAMLGAVTVTLNALRDSAREARARAEERA